MYYDSKIHTCTALSSKSDFFWEVRVIRVIHIEPVTSCRSPKRDLATSLHESGQTCAGFAPHCQVQFCTLPNPFWCHPWWPWPAWVGTSEGQVIQWLVEQGHRVSHSQALFRQLSSPDQIFELGGQASQSSFKMKFILNTPLHQVTKSKTGPRFDPNKSSKSVKAHCFSEKAATFRSADNDKVVIIWPGWLWSHRRATFSKQPS